MRRGSGLHVGCRMEVEEETQSEKKIDEQRKNLQRQLRDIGKFTFMEPAVREAQKREVYVSAARCRKEKDRPCA